MTSRAKAKLAARTERFVRLGRARAALLPGGVLGASPHRARRYPRADPRWIGRRRPGGRVLWANQTFRAMLEHPEEEIAGRPCQDLHVGYFCKELCPLLSGGPVCQVDTHLNVEVKPAEEDARVCLLQVMELFRSAAHERGAAVIVVTHDHRTLDLVDRIFQMEDGLLGSPFTAAAAAPGTG